MAGHDTSVPICYLRSGRSCHQHVCSPGSSSKVSGLRVCRKSLPWLQQLANIEQTIQEIDRVPSFMLRMVGPFL